MKFKKLILKNWHQHEDLTIDFKDKTTISGKNKAGKTNINSAIHFIIDGKDVYNRQVTSTRSIMLGKETTEVELVLKDDTSFKKIIGYDTNQNKHIFNGAELKKKEYDNKLKEYGLHDARMFINPLFFNKQLAWGKRSEILISKFTKITHDEILRVSPDIKDLVEIYKKKNLNHDEYLSKVRKDYKDLKKKQDEINIRIQEASKQPNDFDFKNMGLIEETIVSLEKKLEGQRAYRQMVTDSAVVQIKCAACGNNLDGIKSGKLTKKGAEQIQKLISFIDDNGVAMKESKDALNLLLDRGIEKETDGKETSRIIELKKELSEVTTQIEEKEKWLFLIEKYEEVKKRLAEEQINEVFENIKFNFFEIQKNKEIKQVCNPVSIDGITAEYWSTGESILSGLEICDKLQFAYDIDLPILVDNAESVSDDIKCDRQLILFEMDKDIKKIEVK